VVLGKGGGLPAPDGVCLWVRGGGGVQLVCRFRTISSFPTLARVAVFHSF
jgi:hypothetical protein